MITIERRFLSILALVGVIILVHQGLDLLSLAGGADLATPTGRLGLVAILWTRGPALLTADAFLVMAAVLSSWTRLLAVMAIIHLLLGAAALSDAPFFLADAGRMAGTIATPGLTSFRITVVRILAALITIGVGAAVAGVSLVQVGRPERKPG
jgi:hypothetical protein